MGLRPPLLRDDKNANFIMWNLYSRREKDQLLRYEDMSIVNFKALDQFSMFLIRPEKFWLRKLSRV